MFPASSHYSTGTKESVETVLLLYYLLVNVSCLLSLQYRHERKSVETVLLLYYLLVNVSCLLSLQYRHERKSVETVLLLDYPSSSHYSTGIEEEVLRQFCFFIITYLYSEA
jgi:hypothetical protein